jgi:hypothetical protein
MQLTINKHYNFLFDPTGDVFNQLNGIYFVERALVHADIINEEIDLYVDLYEKVGLAEAELHAQLDNYMNGVYYKLVSPEDGSFIWMPESLMVGYPDANVAMYKKVMLLTDLGVFDDPDVLLAIKDIVNNTIKAKVGTLLVNDEQVEPTTIVSVYGTVWLTHEQYANIATDRNNIAKRDPNYVVDYHERYIQQLAEVARLNTQITALEEIVATLHQSIAEA